MVTKDFFIQWICTACPSMKRASSITYFKMGGFLIQALKLIMRENNMTYNRCASVQMSKTHGEPELSRSAHCLKWWGGGGYKSKNKEPQKYAGKTQAAVHVGYKVMIQPWYSLQQQQMIVSK